MRPFVQRIYDQVASLREIQERLDGDGREELALIGRLAGERPNIIFAGMGASAYAAIPATCMLASAGVFAVSLDASELLYYGELPFPSLVVLISKSGRTVEVVRLAEKLRAQNVQCVAVTNCTASPLSEMCGTSLWVAGRLDRGVSVQTYTGGILTLLNLASTIIGSDKQLSASVTPILDSLDECLPLWEELATRWAASSTARSFTFLARGASMASTKEGALLFQEVSRRPSCAEGAAVFRQGPVEAISDRDAVFVFAPEGRTRHLNISLVRNLSMLGCQALLVGPAEPNLPESVVTIPVPEVHEFLAPLIEVIPIQFAAYALSLSGSHQAGEFRHAAQTTVDELDFGGLEK